MLSFVGDDLQLYEALTQLYQQEGAEAASWGILDAPTLEYILKAVALQSIRKEMIGFSLDSFTPETLKVLTQGKEAMRSLHLNWFGTEGLILGLLNVETTPATKALKEQSITFGIAQGLLRNWLAKCTVPAADIPAEIPFTPCAHLVLELTAEQAKQKAHEQITPQHLLLGILLEGEIDSGIKPARGLATRVLQECKVDCQKLKKQLNST